MAHLVVFGCHHPSRMSSGPHARSHCLQVAIAVSAQGASLCKNFSVLPGVTSLAHTLTVYNSEFGSPCFWYTPIYHGLSYRLLSVPSCIRILVPPAPVTPPALQWLFSLPHTHSSSSPMVDSECSYLLKAFSLLPHIFICWVCQSA